MFGFSKKIKQKSKIQINQTNSNAASLSPHFIVQCGMMRSTLAAQILRRIRSAFRQRYSVMHQRCFDIPTFFHAHFAERMPCQLHRTDRLPCGGMVPLLVRWVTVETVVVPVCFLPVLRAKLSIRQVWTAGILAGLQWFSGHMLHLHILPGNRKALTGFTLQRLRCCVLFLRTVLFSLSSIIIPHRKRLCNHFSRNIVEHS